MPPAFTLSQDQTLRFISAPTSPPNGIATPGRCCRSINEQTRTHGFVPIRHDERHHAETEQPSKRTVTHQRRYASRRPQGRTIKSECYSPRPSVRPLDQPRARARRPEGAANVSLPSLCNCQRPKQRHPQPRQERVQQMTCSDVRQTRRRTRSLAQPHQGCKRQIEAPRCSGSAM